MSRVRGSAKLPGLHVVNTGNPALDRWIQAVSERLEVREGNRGNPHERAVTLRELEDLGLTSDARGAQAGVMVRQPDGTYVTLTVDAFADSIRATKLYKDLLTKLDDVTRFDDVPTQVRAILLNDIAAEAQKRGADIQRLEQKLQSTAESLAYATQEVTASVEGAMAGVRELTYAKADGDLVTAGKVTQIEARLDNVGGVTIEESLMATASRVSGLSGEYMVKINAGGAVAGIGLAASEDPNGYTESAFIVQADKFAVTTASAPGIIPFGVDASGVYINGSLRINSSSGTALQDAVAGTDGKSTYTATIYRRSASALTVAPSEGSFNFGTNALTPPTGWFSSPPGGTNPLYVSTTTFSIPGDTGTATAGTWSAPILFVQDGAPGASGNSTYAYPVYKRSASPIYVPPSGGQYDFGANIGTPPATWSNTVPAGPDPLYVSTTIASAPGATGIATALTWSVPTKLVQDGLQGEQGLQGNPGASTYTWVAYANNSTGTLDFTRGANTGQTYIGIANNKLTAVESTDPAQYVWSLIKGDQGVPGATGPTGDTTYTWFAYANNASGTSGFTTGAWAGQTYLGIASNKSTATESTVPSDYTWSLIKGEQGPAGPASTVPGPAGTRGTIVTKISGGWNANTAASAVQTIASAAGATPTYPIRGDIVYYAGGAMECISAGYPGSWTGVAAYIDGSLVVSGTISASSIAAGNLTAFNISTAYSGARWDISGGAYAMQIRGFNNVNTVTSHIDSVSGTINLTSFTAQSSEFSSASTSYCLRGSNSSSGAGLYGRSTSGHGAQLEGNSSGAPLHLQPLASLPSNRSAGSVCFYNGNLCIANGVHWYTFTGMSQLT